MSLKKNLKSLHSWINYSTSVTVNNRSFSIPIIHNLGLSNRQLHDNWLLQLLKALPLPPGASFVDIGANVGQTLLVFKSCSDNPYWGFEPNPNCVFYLNALKEKNRLNGVRIIPTGVSDATKIGVFYSKGGSDTAATTIEGLRPDYYAAEDASYVPLFRFDDLQLDGLDAIALVKIDVEGGELEVISGMQETLRNHQPLLICEILDCHSEASIAPMQQRASQLLDVMRGAGYELFRIDARGASVLLEPVADVRLRLWSDDSAYLNDYLFAPVGYGLGEKIARGEVPLGFKK